MKQPKIEKIDVFDYAGYQVPPEDNMPKNELWVQLKLLQDKINEIIERLT